MKWVYMKADFLKTLSVETTENQQSLQYDIRWLFKVRRVSLKTICNQNFIGRDLEQQKNCVHEDGENAGEEVFMRNFLILKIIKIQVWLDKLKNLR